MRPLAENGRIGLGRGAAIVTVARFGALPTVYGGAVRHAAGRRGVGAAAARTLIAARETRNAGGALRWTSGPPVVGGPKRHHGPGSGLRAGVRSGRDVPSNARTTRLVIVESPAKAKTISGYLGPGYVVEASFGHVRDLPAQRRRRAGQVQGRAVGPARASTSTTASTPLYVVSADRKQQISKLMKLAKEVDEIFLATDEDREGEAIAWHLVETLKPKVPVKRMVFHEITKPAIQAAVANPREIDRTWSTPRRPGASSTGSTATRSPRCCGRRSCRGSRPAGCSRWRPGSWSSGSGSGWRSAPPSTGTSWPPSPVAKPGEGPRTFNATLVALDGDRIATGKDFEPTTGQVRPGAGVVHLDESGARGLAARLEGRPFTVTRVEEKPYRRRPYAPFITSTLQQEAARKLRFSSQQTMRTAQRLYENGYITYMRTDSVNLSETAIAAARRQIVELYGERSVPPEPRRYTGKVKNAQEAHEAIRPAGDNFRTPGEVAKELSAEEFKLYELIWRRTIASQMTDAVGSSVSVRIRAVSAAQEEADFGATGKTITDPGFLRGVRRVQRRRERRGRGRRAPAAHPGQGPAADRRRADRDRATTPSRRRATPRRRWSRRWRSWASAARRRTRRSCRRSRTAGTSTKRGQALIPTFLAFAVIGLLERHYPRLVDYDFTAAWRTSWTRSPAATTPRVDFLTAFYFGSSNGAGDQAIARAGGLKKLVTENLSEIDARSVNSIPLFTDDEGREVVVRVGRYGPYLQRALPGGEQPTPEVDGEEGGSPGDRAPIPEGLAPDELTPEKVHELFLGGGGERKLGDDPATGEPIVLKSGRFGPYVSSGERKSSLLRTQSPGLAHPRRGAASCSACPGWSAWTRTAARSSPATAATARTSSGATTSARWTPRTRSSRSRWTRRWPCWPRRRPASAGPPRRRCARWASTRSPRSRW